MDQALNGPLVAPGVLIVWSVTLLIFFVFLIILVILMFVITIKSNNPNILNYKEAIINEYASWEEELNAREEAIKEKEKELEDTGSR